MTDSTRTIVYGAAGFVASAVVAFFIGNALGGSDPASAALPEFEQTLPVITGTPVFPGDDIAALAIEASEQDLAARETASEIGVALDPGTRGSFGSSSDGFDLDPDSTDGDPAPADPADGPPGPDTAAADTATDECADGGDGCPDGVGGTILLAIRALPPLSGYAGFNPGEVAEYGWSPACPAIEVPGGAAYFGFATNRPAVITMDYRAGAWFAGSYEVEGTYTYTTPDADEAGWNEWVADETLPADDPRAWITHCVLVEGLPPHSDYDGFISYADKYDLSVTSPNWRRPVEFAVANEDGLIPGEQRRPTVLLGYGIDDLRIGVTRRPDQSVVSVALPDARPGSCNTGGDASTVFSRDDTRDSRSLSVRDIPSEELSDSAYPYFADYSVSEVMQIGLQEGTDYLVCIYWLTAGPVFDPLVVDLAEEVFVGTPEAYRPEITFHGVTGLFGEIDEAGFGMRGCGSETIELSGFSAGDSRMLPEPVVLCTLEDDLTAHDRGMALLTSVHSSFEDRSLSGGSYFRRDLECHGECRIRLDDMLRIPLPDVPTERRLCGSGFGGGCDGEIPMRSAGEAIVSVAYIRVPGNGRAFWSIGEAAEFVDDAPVPTSEIPLMDVQVSYALGSHPLNGAVATIRVVPDRPISLDVAVVAQPDCGFESPSVYSNSAFLMAHEFTLDPLCLGNEYQFEFTAFAESGEQATIVERPLGQIGSVKRLIVPPLFTTTPMTVTITAPDNDHRHTIYVRPVTFAVPSIFPPYGGVNGWSWPASDRSVAAARGWQMFGVDGQANACGEPGAGPLTVNSARPTVLLPQSDIMVTLDVYVHENRPLGGAIVGECVPGEIVGSYTLQATVTLLELVEGVELISADGNAVFEIRATDWRSELIGGY